LSAQSSSCHTYDQPLPIENFRKISNPPCLFPAGAHIFAAALNEKQPQAVLASILISSREIDKPL
jgi:hypothetical protein